MTTSVSDTSDISERLQNIGLLVGNSPLLEIEYTYRGSRSSIYAKAEHGNLSGSIKDRMAYHVLCEAYATGAIREGDTIAEATSGNTGIAFSAIGRALGHPVVIFMPDWMSRERVDLIRALGARIVQVSSGEGGFIGSIEKAEAMAREQSGVFLPRQFSNPANVNAHSLTTGPEILKQLGLRSLKPSAFVAGVGTGGTIMGVGGFLREHAPGIRLHPVQPAESPTLSTGHKVGKHRIQGISDEFIPEIVELKRLDDILSVHDGDAIIAAQKLASQIGLGVGISSGGNVIGAIMVKEAMGPDAVIVTVLSDCNKKYLSTDLMREEPVKPEYLSSAVEFTRYSAIRRLCPSCDDGAGIPDGGPQRRP